jgi:hypothetical protein
MKTSHSRRIQVIQTKRQALAQQAAYLLVTKGDLGIEEQLDQERLDAMRHNFDLRPILRANIR